MALQHEHVRTAHRLGEPHVHLTVGKVVSGGLENLNAQAFGHFLGQLGVGAARDQNESFIRSAFKNCRHAFASFCVAVFLALTSVLAPHRSACREVGLCCKSAAIVDEHAALSRPDHRIGKLLTG